MTNAPMPYLIAVDGGGTGCRALLAKADGNVIGKAVGGPANIGADTAMAIANVMETVTRAVHDAGLHISRLNETGAVLGLAGANSIPDRLKLVAGLPFARVRIVSDTVTALQGALGDNDGAIVILGTGSAFVRQAQGTAESIGGRGFMLSDHAGGARLGRELLEETLLAFDGMAGRTELTEAVMVRFNDDLRQIISFSRKATAADYAIFAPLVFEYAAKGDPLGLSIAERACAYIKKGLDRLEVETLGRFSLTGGLASSYAALPFLPYPALYHPPRGDALEGALSLAMLENRWD
ncbi:N-acetylglucosamine kinase [Brucella sp. 10RB9215]|uniref:N-acetylglucosamine kinase n=1 Tax=Brucella sp. 10RB9215 TaxID=1149953 RepID=UPI00090A1ECC|nr:N-acetylglucosamine kinase [Brucella sp. 10RB9215]SBW16211.1 N-acetylglucosamine kinase [Brucella sp. 10RB9215]